jgi:tetratricopeptide (TPR) repeat protein
MKKSFLLSFLLVGTIVLNAQDYKSEFSSAKKAFIAFQLDMIGNKAKLTDAVTSISKAVTFQEANLTPEAFLKSGEIMAELADQIVTTKQLGVGSLDDLPKVDNPELIAFDHFMKAMDMAVKPADKKKTLKLIGALQNSLSNIGVYNYDEQKYEMAFKDFSTVIAIHDMLKKAGEVSTLDIEADYLNQVYISGLAAFNGGFDADAEKYFTMLADKQYDKPAIYESLYNLKAKKSTPEEAYPILENARKQFPEDLSLLFVEINHYLKLQKMNELIERLETAIKLEPSNVSLYSVMGNVYDNLHQKIAKDNGDPVVAEGYFIKSLEYFNKAIEMDPKNVEALYSIGALYYNKAAVTSQKMNALSEDYSKEGLKKFNDLKAQVFKQFDESLPYFQRAEALNPNDTNTLIALKEIYAKKDQLDLSKEFKTRLELVQGGGKNDKSYFPNN